MAKVVRRKFRVYGRTTVNVIVEVCAKDGDDAMKKAYEILPSLIEYAGNGGTDKLVGVEDDDHSVSVDDYITYDDYDLED